MSHFDSTENRALDASQPRTEMALPGALADLFGVAVLDVDGVVLDANPLLLGWLGRPELAVLGRPLQDFVARGERPLTASADGLGQLRDGAGLRRAVILRAPDGATRRIEAAFAPTLDGLGQVTQIVVLATDASPTGRTAEPDRAMLDTLDRSLGDPTAREPLAAGLAGAVTGAVVRPPGSIQALVDTIGEIASHGHRLAFSAAIEAARAGEHGAALSVVADEVRRLAERSTAAAREMSSLVGETGARVHQGTRGPKQIERAYKRIERSVERACDRVGSVHRALQQQAQATSRVAELLEQLLAAARA